MPNAWVVYYTNLAKAEYEGLLPDHGFSDIEMDVSSDGQWHGEYPNESKDLGKAAFWKKKDSDGIVVSEVKFYDGSGSTVHGTGINAVGGAYKYFKGLEYDQGSERKEKITVNGRRLDSFDIFGSVEFRKFLEMPNVKRVGSVMKDLRWRAIDVKEYSHPVGASANLGELKTLKQSGMKLPIDEIKPLFEVIYKNGINACIENSKDENEQNGKEYFLNRAQEYEKDLPAIIAELKSFNPKRWWQLWQF